VKTLTALNEDDAKGQSAALMGICQEKQPPSAYPSPHSLGQLILALEALCARNHGTKVSVGDVVNLLGPRSFAPIILAIGLIAVTPIDSIPTLPTTFGVVIFLTVGQMLIGRKSLWLPTFISRRALPADRLKSALRRLDPYAARADRWFGMRLTVFTEGPFLPLIALCCALLAALMPFLEFLPLVSTLPAFAFAAFGIALLLRDGVAAVLGLGFTILTLTVVSELFRPIFAHLGLS
jgi:hypothetical protein